MCGIAALIRLSHRPIAPSVVDRMTDAVAHRGPDGRGVAYYSIGESGLQEADPAMQPDWRVALGHRRLSILDLSDAGRQPMSYRDRLWLTYNGEIYNYVELRADLERSGHVFRSHTDTEVILAAYDEWGPACFERLRGMWGLALLDGRRRTVVISRDRLGIKPVYTMRIADWLAVASEIKQFRALPGAQLTPDEGVLQDYLRTGYEREGESFFAEAKPLQPGTWQEFSLSRDELSPPTPYWFPEANPAFDFRSGKQPPTAFTRCFKRPSGSTCEATCRSAAPAARGVVEQLLRLAGFIHNLESNDGHRLQYI